MKRILFFLITLTILVCGSFTTKVATELCLEDAIKKGLVAVVVKSKGGHQGECVTIEVRNLKSSASSIKIEAGRRLNSSNDEEQDLLVVKDYFVHLKANEKKQIPVGGFCCQLDNHSPGAGAGYKAGGIADEKLLKLAQFLNGKNFPDNIIQEAVWCVSDGENPSNISLDDDLEKSPMGVKVKELRKFICSLVGKDDPWYSSPQKRIETPERIIVPNPVEVYGAIKYKVKNSTVINSELQDENGNVIFKMPGKSLTGIGEWDYNFHLTVEGFERGTYHVILRAGTEKILDQSFTI